VPLAVMKKPPVGLGQTLCNSEVVPIGFQRRGEIALRHEHRDHCEETAYLPIADIVSGCIDVRLVPIADS
jgi:hypothetical protein